MRDLSVTEIEMVGGGLSWTDFFSGMGEAVSNWFQSMGQALSTAVQSIINHTPSPTANDIQVMQMCVTAGGLPQYQATPTGYNLTINLPNQTVNLSSDAGGTTISCIPK